MSDEKKRPAYIWLATIFSSAALLGFAIGGLVPWWAFLIPWVLYAVIVLTFLVLVFLEAYISALVVALVQYREEKEKREKV